jgi:hypothetical protein
MGMKFRKRIKIAPGVNINLSKSGASVSVGKPGATVNVGGKDGARATVGIPGSGLSHTEQLYKPRRKSANSETKVESTSLGFFEILGCGVLALLAFLVFSGLLGS